MSRAEMDKDPFDVASMFDGVAKRYDLVNDLLSLGQTRRWRVRVTEALAPQAGERILDLAAGTGTSSLALAATGAQVVSADFSLGMLRQGASQYAGMNFCAADALNLPFADGSFAAATISFGLRNVQDVPRALTEMRRVVRPGGRLLICEFSTPTNSIFRTIYQTYLVTFLRWAARRFASNPAAYEYLADSILAWPDQAGLAAQIQAAGWQKVSWLNVTGGVVALHRAQN
ncbi:MAG: demethylmenaquinone methyltransferase [Actinomycetes bacterium]